MMMNNNNNKTGKGVKFEEEEEEGEIEKLLLGIMDGYEDSAIPSLEKISPSSKVNNNNYFPGCSRKRERVMVSSSAAAAMTRTTTDNNNNNGGVGVGGGVMHKERSRRENMAEKYSLLRSLVPTLNSMTKVSRAEIVNEATNYIKTLEEEKKKLEDQKRCILQQQQQRIGTPGLLPQCMNMNLKPSVDVCVCNGGIAVFGIHLLVKRGLLIKIFHVFEKYETEVLGATINGYGQLTFTCKFNNSGCNNQTDIVIENIKKDILSL